MYFLSRFARIFTGENWRGRGFAEVYEFASLEFSLILLKTVLRSLSGRIFDFLILTFFEALSETLFIFDFLL